MKKEKKLLALLLTFVLCIGMLPTSAFAMDFTCGNVSSYDGNAAVFDDGTAGGAGQTVQTPTPAPETQTTPAAENEEPNVEEITVEEETPGEEVTPGEEEIPTEETTPADDSIIVEEPETTEPTPTPETTPVAEENNVVNSDDIFTSVPDEVADDSEIAMPAQDFNGELDDVKVIVNAPEGAFPEGTVMTVSEADEEAVQAAAEAAEAEKEDVKAVDITFTVNNQEIEPAVAINVTLDAGLEKELVDEAVVVHVDDEINTEVITDTVVEGDQVTFEAEAFSVYAIVAPDTRTTYEFYNGDTLVETQIVKAGDILVEPAIPEGDGEFLGWFVGEEKLTFGQVSAGKEGQTVRVDAKFNSTVYVTFYDADGTTVVAVKKAENGAVTTDDIVAQPLTAGQAFDGWTTTPNGTEKVGSTFYTEVNASLYPVFVSAAWLTFNANGDGATATETQYVRAGGTTTEPADPQRPGYTFEGWYTEAEGGERFTFGEQLTSNTTVYAHWAPAAANYTVIIWKQKVTDDKDATDAQKTYDYEESEAVSSFTGEKATVRSEDITKNYTGFHLGRYDSEKTVAADGSTIVNVYYDRNLNKIIFHGWGDEVTYYYTPTNSTNGNNTYYGLVNGQYVELTRKSETESYLSTRWNGAEYTGTVYIRTGDRWNPEYSEASAPYDKDETYYYHERSIFGDYHRLYWVDNTTYTWMTPDGSLYTGTRYIRESVSGTVYTGLYGQNFEQYGYEWPSDYEWNESPDGRGTTQTFLNSFSVTDTNYILYSQGKNQNTSTVYHYIEKIDSTDSNNVNNYILGGSAKKSSRATFNFSDKFTGFEVYGYRTSPWDDNMTVLGNTTSVSSQGDLHVYHKRNSYTITFINGDKTVDTVSKKFQAPLSENDAPSGNTLTYPGNAADASHYSFAGWYTDPDGTTPFDFSGTMPSNNLVAYAKWVPEQITVTYIANGGSINGQETFEETIDYNGKASGAYAIWENHTFLGWEDAEGNLWNFESPVTRDLELTAAWRSDIALRVAYDIESVVDDSTYTDGSRAIVKDYKDADERFIGWKLGETVYYPGDIIEVNSANDVLDGEGDGIVTLTAVFDELERTSITFDANGGSFTTASAETIEMELANNEGVDLDTVETPVRKGYKFLGWALTETATAAEYVADGTDAEEIAADYEGENVLYAVWEEEFFNIYHSSVAGGAVEKISMTQINEDGTYDIVNHTAQGYYYGGYYKKYNKEGTVYAGGAGSWSKTNAYTVNGSAMQPVAGATYYLKEVPADYLQPYLHVVYDTRSQEIPNELKKMYLMTGVDDLNYTEIGLNVTNMTLGTRKTAASFKVQDSVNSGNSVTITTNSIWGVKGFLGIWDQSADLKAEYVFSYQPYFVTPDGVKVSGNKTRTVNTQNNHYYNTFDQGEDNPGIYRIDQ